jgi:hypothetical protein
MKNLRISPLLSVVLVLAPAAFAAKTPSDLAPPPKRQQTVDTALHLARPPVAAPLPEGFPGPFNPSGFDQPDPDEKSSGATHAATGATAAGPAAPTGPTNDRELLEVIAARIQPTGYFALGGKPILTFPGAKRFTIGDSFIVTYPPSGGQDYELKIVAIDRTSFTLRYRGEEITRPIAKTK